MTPIQSKYLAIARNGLRKIEDEYFELAKSASNQRVAYKLVDRYHQHVRQFLDKLNRQGMAELQNGA